MFASDQVHVVCKYFLPFCRFPFHSVYSFLCCIELFKFCVVTFVFAFVTVYGVISKKPLSNPMSWSFSIMFSSRNFIVLDLMFSSIICFELIFLYGLRWGSNFTLFCLNTQFSKHQLCFCILTMKNLKGNWQSSLIYNNIKRMKYLR